MNLDPNTGYLALIILLVLERLGIFSRKEDTGKVWTALAKLEAKIANEYVHKDDLTEIKSQIRDMRDMIEKMMILIIEKKENK